MSFACEIDTTIDYCACCGDEFVQNAGRYIFNDNAYCPVCWGKGALHMMLSDDMMSGRVMGSDD